MDNVGRTKRRCRNRTGQRDGKRERRRNELQRWQSQRSVTARGGISFDVHAWWHGCCKWLAWDEWNQPHNNYTNTVSRQIYGGTGFPFGSSCSNSVHVIFPYHQPSPTVRKLETSGSAPPPLYGQSILVFDGHLYVVGGTTGYDYTCDIHRLDLRTRVWQAVNVCRPENLDDPAGRYRHEIVTDGDFMYVIGGGTASRTFGLDTVPAFNLHTRVWTKLQTLPDVEAPTPGVPLARKCHSCVNQRNANGEVSVSWYSAWLTQYIQ